MIINRRKFISASMLTAGASLLSSEIFAVGKAIEGITNRFDPWLEIDPQALRYNISQLHRLSGGRPVLAVVKNNAYGLGLDAVSRILDGMPELAGFAGVKTETSLSMRKNGIKKPILLMGMPEEGSLEDLLMNDIQLALYTKELQKQLDKTARKLKQQASIQVYVDTGMSRMGIPYNKALPLIEQIESTPSIRLAGAFTSFTEDAEFDRE